MCRISTKISTMNSVPLSPSLRRQAQGMAGLVQYRRDSIAALIAAYGRRVKYPTASGKVAFVMGCGRSGTSILGEALSLHPDVTYHREPRPVWHHIDKRTAIWGFLSAPGVLPLEESDFTGKQERRFRRLLLHAPTACVVEKSPEATFRIGWLMRLAPQATFIHIIRDGASVIRSIVALSTQSIPHGLAKSHNLWWGIEDRKWSVFAEGILPTLGLEAEPWRLSPTERACCEWLAAIEYVERWQERMGRQLTTVRYEDMISESQVVLPQIAAAIGLTSPEHWVREAGNIFFKPTRQSNSSIHLRPELAQRFNQTQFRLGYEPCAQVARSEHEVFDLRPETLSAWQDGEAEQAGIPEHKSTE